MFNKYMHLERLGTDAVEGIELGRTYVFPKLDGTNASVWVEDAEIKAGSRNRQLTLDNDNAGFYNEIIEDKNIESLLKGYPELTLYGEWLVPHSLKTYRDDAWRKFYVFDVYNRETNTYYSYDRYKEILDEYGIEYLAPIAIITNGDQESYVKCLDKNVFLIQDGQGVGEGVVIKNYDFVNRFGNVVWAKLITTAFKEVHHKEMGAPIIGGRLVEEDIVDGFVTNHLVEKTYAKIVNEEEGWQSRYIPKLLGMVWYDFINEELWNALKKYKNPRINFKTLQRLCVEKVKKVKPDVF